MNENGVDLLPALRFKPAADSAFRKALQREAQACLAAHGTHRFADGWLYLKAISLAAAVVLAYLLALRAGNRWHFMGAFVAFLFLAMVLAMNTLHDAAHGALFRSKRVNRLLMRLVSLPVGIDPDYWTIRHVHFHHTYANIDGYDLDIEPNPFLRQTPFQRWSPQYRAQHLYWPLVAALSLPYLCWYSDWADRFGKTRLAGRGDLAGWRAWLVFFAAKAAHLILVLLLPVWALHGSGMGWGVVPAAYLAGQMLASCFLVAMILGTHWAEVEFFLPGKDGSMPHTWYEHTFRTSCDWRPRPAWLGYWLGGLNSHLTHHLFPTYSHRHYPRLAEIVEDLAHRHGLRYRALRYGQLLASQQHFLKSMGKQPAPMAPTHA
jgi:linoleoyl-CoA desaturase